MQVKIKFNEINVKEEKEKTLVKVLMLKGEKGDTVSAEWGTITGYLNSQTDLKNALNSKANQSEVIQALSQKANASDLNNYYNKSQMDNALGSKIGTQDIVDRLDSASSDKVLSANQGKVLKDEIDTKVSLSDIEETFVKIEQLNNETTSRINSDNTLQTNITNEANARNLADNDLQSQINSLASGSPLVASSTDEMTDTTRTYVNTTDGNWYYYDGSTWQIGGVYQATAIADGSITAKKTNFLSSSNLIWGDIPSKSGFCVTGSGSAPSSFAISTLYNRYLSIITVKPNTDYSLFFNKILESGVNYFKILSFTETKDEILEYLQTHTTLSGSGSFVYSAGSVPNQFRTGPNDNTIAIQFSNDTEIDYAELLEGIFNSPKFNSFDTCVDIFGFSAYNKEETNNNINIKINGVIDNSYVIDENFDGIERIDGYLVGVGAPEAHNNYSYYEFTADKDFYCYFDFEDYKNRYYLNMSLFNGSIDSAHYLSRNRYNINAGGSDNNLPDIDNQLLIRSGTVVTITVFKNDGYDFRMYTDYELSSRMKDSVGLTKEQKTEVHSMLVDSQNQFNKYSLSSNVLTIFNQKAKYIFKEVVNNSINLNTWRLYSGDLLQDGEIFANMWSNSDAEGPIKINGEQDFVGGFHGDEIMTDLKIIVDGNLIDHTGVVQESYFKNITIVCKSNVYHCDTSAKAGIIAFERTKKLVFEKEKVTITNKYIVVDDYGFTITRAATALFQCYKKDSEDNMLLNYVNTNSDLNLYPVSIDGSQMPSGSQDMKEAYYYTTVGVIKQKITKGYTVGTYNPFVEDYVEQYRLKTYFCYENFSVVKNQILLSEFEWEIV